MRVRFGRRARRDYDEHVDYLLARDPAAALAFLEAFDEATALLRVHPAAGRRAVMATGRELRLWPLAPMVLYYEVRAGTLLIVRLRHGAQRPITR